MNLYLQKNISPLKTIKTCDSFDNCLGGGVPYGKIIELSGDVDSGKTSLLFDIIQKVSSDTVIVYMSTSSTSLGYLIERKIHEQDNFVLFRSNRESEILDFINKTKNYVDLFILDSITNVLTKNEIGKTDSSFQELPRFLGELNQIFYGEKSSMIVVNSIVFKNRAMVSRWANMFNKYCVARIRLFENKLKLLTHKTRPELVKERIDEL